MNKKKNKKKSTVQTSPKNSKSFSQELEDWLKSDQTKTLIKLNQVFGDRTFAIIFMLLMATSALPIPTAGITVVFSAITILFAAQMMLGQNELWLPRRWKKVKIGKTLTNKLLPKLAKVIKKLEKHSTPRLVRIFEGRISDFIFSLIVAVFAFATIVAPPFSGLDTLPAMAVVFISLGIILKDGAISIFGICIGSIGLLLQISFANAVIRFIQALI